MGFKAWGLAVQGLGVRVLNVEFWAQGSGYRMFVFAQLGPWLAVGSVLLDRLLLHAPGGLGFRALGFGD